MKRFTKSALALLLSMAILACVLTPSAFAASNIVDIADNPHRDSILVLDAYGALAGIVDQDGKFYPNDPCTVVVFTQFLRNMYPTVPVPSEYTTSNVISQKGATNILFHYSSSLGHTVTWSGGDPAAAITRGDAAAYITGMLDCEPELVKLINTTNNNTPVTPSIPSNPTNTTGKFEDVSPNAYYYMAVDWAVGYGIVAGTSPTTFSPDDTCSVAQVLTLLYRVNGTPTPSKKDACPFTNIPVGSWAYDAMRWANGKGLISGDTTNPLSTPCTRAYLVNCLWQLAGKPRTSTSIKHFEDVPNDATYASAIKWALSRSITSGTSTTSFSPFDTVTRGQVVTFIYRTYATS